jgi:hypothetical protein
MEPTTEAAAPRTITLPDWPDEQHIVGNQACREGWCSGGSSYPHDHTDCEADPRGLVHAAFGDENADGDYWLFTKCDACGESE